MSRPLTTAQARAIGKIGGKNGRGKSKTRPRSHYLMLVKIRALNAKKRRAAAVKEAKKA